MKNTLDYYNRNAQQFVAGTREVCFRETQDRFIRLLPEKGKILDFGCGSGRDTKYFLEQGYSVEAIDGSEELCKLASEYTGIEVRQMLFQDFHEKNAYDGIWACSSILHLSLQELLPVMKQIREALKEEGVLYTSFKYGDFEGDRSGRYYTDFTEESLACFLKQVPGLTLEEYWITGDVREGRHQERWLNVILRNQSCSVWDGNFEFRKIRANEAEAATRIEAICFPPSEACTLPIMKERILLAGDCYLVAVDHEAEQMVGFVNGLCTEEEVLRDELFTDTSLHDPHGKNIMICSVSVLPEYRGRGLARKMMQEFLKRQKEMGRKQAILTCVPGKIGMYQKFGYTDRGESQSEWGGEVWHEMYCILNEEQ